MKVKVIVESRDLSAEELYQLLQAIRDCEQEKFPQKPMTIWVEAPDLLTTEAEALLARITPPFPFKYGPMWAEPFGSPRHIFDPPLWGGPTFK